MGISYFPGCTYYNFQLISPAFKYETSEDYWTEEEKKNPGRFKKEKLLLEVLIPRTGSQNSNAPASIFAINLHHRMGVYRFISFSGIAGFIYTASPSIDSREKVHINCGLSTRFDLRYIAPYFEVSTGCYLTTGIEFHINKIYRKLTRRYDLDIEG